MLNNKYQVSVARVYNYDVKLRRMEKDRLALEKA